MSERRCSIDRSPFLEDPRDLIVEQVALAVASPIEAVRAIHLRAAEHLAEVARVSALPLKPAAGLRKPKI